MANVDKIKRILSSDENIEMLRRHRNDVIKKNMRTNFLAISSYKKIISILSKFTSEMAIDNNNPISLYVIFSYLLWNGYLSNNKSFSFSNKDLYSLDGFFGFDVVNGKGCCRSIADMLKDLLKNLNYEEAYFLVNSTSILMRTYALDIIRKDGNEELLPPKLNVMLKHKEIDDLGNHASTLLKIKDNYYVLDATNLAIYKMTSANYAELYNGNGKCFAPNWGYRIYEDMDVNMVKQLLDALQNQRLSSFLLDREVKEIEETTLNKCKLCKSSIEDFSAEISPEIDIIVRKLIK